jgi:hypothetical protein
MREAEQEEEEEAKEEEKESVSTVGKRRRSKKLMLGRTQRTAPLPVLEQLPISWHRRFLSTL